MIWIIVLLLVLWLLGHADLNGWLGGFILLLPVILFLIVIVRNILSGA